MYFIFGTELCQVSLSTLRCAKTRLAQYTSQAIFQSMSPVWNFTAGKNSTQLPRVVCSVEFLLLSELPLQHQVVAA